MSGEDVRVHPRPATGTASAQGGSATRTRVIEEPAWYPEPAKERAWAVPKPREEIEDAIRRIVEEPPKRRPTLVNLAIELGVDYSTVRRWRTKLGMPHPAEIARSLPRTTSRPRDHRPR